MIEAEHPAVTLDNSTILSSGYRNRKFKRKPEALLNKHFTSVPLRCLTNRAMQLMQSRRIERHIQDQVKYLGCSFLWKQLTAFGQRNGVLDVWINYESFYQVNFDYASLSVILFTFHLLILLYYDSLYHYFYLWLVQS